MDDTSLRARLREQTAREIEAAALRLFREQGYAETTVDQIAAAAGISPRTFFRYFETKEAVLFRDHAAKLERFRAALAAQDPGDPPVERVRRAMLEVERPDDRSDLARARADLLAVIPELRAHHASLMEAYESAVADALLPPGAGLDDEVRARAFAGAVFGALRAIAGVSARSGASDHRLFAVVMDMMSGVNLGELAAAGPAPGR